MAIIQVVGDADTGGGLIETPPQSFYFVADKLVSVDTTAVTDHDPDHTGVHTANGRAYFVVNGLPVNVVGNADTCGHTRVGEQAAFFVVE